MLTPQQASKILTRQFHNKENLHRITTEQAQDLNSLITVMNCKVEIMRGVLLRIANRWYIELLFPWIARDLRSAAGFRAMPELVEAVQSDPTPMYTFKRPI